MKCSVGLGSTAPSINGWEAEVHSDGCQGSPIPLLTGSATDQAPCPHPLRAGGQILVASEGPATVPASSVMLARLPARRKPPQRDSESPFVGGYAGASWGQGGVVRLPLLVSFDRAAVCKSSLDLYGQSSTLQRAPGLVVGLKTNALGIFALLFPWLNYEAATLGDSRCFLNSPMTIS